MLHQANPDYDMRERRYLYHDEIVAVEVRGKKGVESFAADEAPRPDTAIEALCDRTGNPTLEIGDRLA
jgi:hypothetical protein